MNVQNNILYLYVENDDLKEKYKEYVEKHNSEIELNYPNSGFDLFFPEDITFGEGETVFANMKIKCEMHRWTMFDRTWNPTGYYLYPRSSISKTSLILANHTGIIDSGYRGNIIGAFKNLSVTYETKKFNRLLQICSPDLKPIHVKIIDSEDFFDKTDRNTGGFGSTGL